MRQDLEFDTGRRVFKGRWHRRRIVQNGSDWQNPNGNRNVAYLNRWNDKRKLNLNWYDNDWNGYYRFLAFR